MPEASAKTLTRFTPALIAGRFKQEVTLLEGTIKLHGQQASGKTRLLLALEKVLAQPEFSDLRIVCKTQQPGCPAQHEVTFTKAPQPDPSKPVPLRSRWTS